MRSPGWRTCRWTTGRSSCGTTSAPGAAGFHDDENEQPFALVQFSNQWALTASHEVLEMLADPFGRRLVAGQSPKAGQGRVQFLVEVCDPSEDTAFAISVNGIKLSDFYTPRYFDPVTAPGCGTASPGRSRRRGRS